MTMKASYSDKNWSLTLSTLLKICHRVDVTRSAVTRRARSESYSLLGRSLHVALKGLRTLASWWLCSQEDKPAVLQAKLLTR